MCDFKEGLEHNKRVLNIINIRPYLKKGMDVYDIQVALSETFNTLVLNDPLMENDLFNYMDIYEFTKYLKERYPDIKISHWEEIHYQIV